ncbi:hypothetical protein HDU81_006253 [Chytriomyces hyalinus]|nr:hypothetical protein HDU81_006253 [Chytriomyces hyalinus]
MKAKTLQINWHDKMPLFSVAFNPEPVLENPSSALEGNQGEPSQINKLATAGGDHNIRLWNVTLDDVSNTSKVDYVATLNRHSSVVNCIRWSNSGSILASGGDDGTLILWQQADKKSQELNSLESAEDLESKEYWKVLSFLRGCSSDIYDIVWSPDSNFVLAGCLDNSARIWNVRENRCIHVLTDHENFVQGVSWDPLNHFIATQSSDRTMHVYSMECLAEVGHEGINIQCIAKQARVKTIRTVVDEFASLGLVEPVVGATVSKGSANDDMDLDGMQDRSENQSRPEELAHAFEGTKYETSIAKKLKLDATAAKDMTSNHSHHSEEASNVELDISDMPASAVPLIATISTANMFHDDTLSSFFRRLTFSPDGSLLVVPAGLHRETTKDIPKNVVYLFTRENLRGDPIARLGGFKKPVIAARFSPVLYEHRNKSESNPSATKLILPYRMMFAVASQDSVVVYDTSRLEKPVAIVSNLHYGTLTDVAWSQNGRVLVLASTDGYCSVVNFTKSELGPVHAAAAPLVENQNWFTTTTGKDSQNALKENNGQTTGSSVNLLHSGLIKKKKAAVVVVALSEAVTGPDGGGGDCGEENRKALASRTEPPTPPLQQHADQSPDLPSARSDDEAPPHTLDASDKAAMDLLLLRSSNTKTEPATVSLPPLHTLLKQTQQLQPAVQFQRVQHYSTYPTQVYLQHRRMSGTNSPATSPSSTPLAVPPMVLPSNSNLNVNVGLGLSAAPVNRRMSVSSIHAFNHLDARRGSMPNPQIQMRVPFVPSQPQVQKRPLDNPTVTAAQLPPAKRRYSVAAFYGNNSAAPIDQRHPSVVVSKLPRQLGQQVIATPPPMRLPMFHNMSRALPAMNSQYHQKHVIPSQPVPPQTQARQNVEAHLKLQQQQQQQQQQLDSQGKQSRSNSITSLISIDSECEDDEHSGETKANSKVSHKLAERVRRTKMNEMFDELKSLLPTEAFSDLKTSKLDVLAKTIEYLRCKEQKLQKQQQSPVEN